MLVGVEKEFAITEIAAEQTEFPEMVGDVFADIADGAIGANNHFLILFGDLASAHCGGLAGAAHHPAARVFTLTLQIEHAPFFELLKGGVPEMQVEDFALAREKVVLDAQPLHGFEVAAKNGCGD